ncbi:MAG: hypothetical protein WCF85_10635 [Rhodospirillaceae bacterium]
MTNQTFTAINPADCTGSSSYLGRILISYDDLVATFGTPLPGDGRKTEAEWLLRFEDGTIAAIYNYKTGKSWSPDGLPVEQITEWHIGGQIKAAARLVLEVLGEKAEIIDLL